jgi:hypothetical protein
VTSEPIDMNIRHRQLRGFKIKDDDSNDRKVLDNDYNNVEGKTRDNHMSNDQDFLSPDRYLERVSAIFLYSPLNFGLHRKFMLLFGKLSSLG